MIAAQGDTAKGKREPAAEPQTARSARQADPGPGLVPWPLQQAATIGISGNAPRHAAQSALAQSGAHTPAVMHASATRVASTRGRTDEADLCVSGLKQLHRGEAPAALGLPLTAAGD
jgi:hypothetical protein